LNSYLRVEDGHQVVGTDRAMVSGGSPVLSSSTAGKLLAGAAKAARAGVGRRASLESSEGDTLSAGSLGPAAASE